MLPRNAEHADAQYDHDNWDDSDLNACEEEVVERALVIRKQGWDHDHWDAQCEGKNGENWVLLEFLRLLQASW